MKKTVALLVFALMLCLCLFAETKWYKTDEVDDFGDPTGHFSVYTDYLSGTYKNQSTSKGSLKYQLKVSEKGALDIYLFEDGKIKDLTTTSSGAYYVNTNELFTIQIKYSNGIVESYYGSLSKDENYKYDCICNRRFDFRDILINESVLKIIISASNGSYNLGSVDTSVIGAWVFFDDSIYNEGVALMGKGLYQEAITKFNNLKSENKESYDYYKAEAKIQECQLELGKATYNEAKTLMDSGEYQKALSKLIILENEYPNEYKSLDGKKLEYDIRKAGSIYTVGSIGPAGGYIFYDKGVYSDGWRYLEAAPADLKVINGVPTVDSSKKGYSSDNGLITFGFEEKEQFKYVNGTTKYNVSNCTGTALGTGKGNTEKLVSKMGLSAYSDSDHKTSDYAARLCDILSYTNYGVIYDDWFLPSKDELNLMFINLCKKGIGDFKPYYDKEYWSSSEYSNSEAAFDAWIQSFYSGEISHQRRGGIYSYSPLCVRPVRMF